MEKEDIDFNELRRRNREAAAEMDHPEFFWPHSDESRLVIHMTWELLLEALDNQDKVASSVYFKTREAKNMRLGIERGKVQAYLKVLARFDSHFCRETDKILLEARKELGERNRPNDT